MNYCSYKDIKKQGFCFDDHSCITSPYSGVHLLGKPHKDDAWQKDVNDRTVLTSFIVKSSHTEAMLVLKPMNHSQET